MADTSVRPATAEDAKEIARIQAAAWSQAYAGVLPAEALAALADENAVAMWAQAAGAPPSARHVLLVAVAGTDVAGFAAMVPATDPDLRPGADAELSALCVDPARTGSGHGSRLVNAAADILSGLGVEVVAVWVSEHDRELRPFLEKAGWAEDGAHRRLDLHGDGTVVVDQRRLRTSLAEHG